MKIALSGGFGSGKTTLATKLETLGYTHIALADLLKSQVIQLYPQYAWDILNDNKTDEIRTLLFETANKYKQKYGYDYYINWALTRIKGNNVVISDIRFEAEAETLIAQKDWTFVWLGKKDNNYDLESIYLIKDILLPSKPSLDDLVDGITKNNKQRKL